uniref:Uncharacterized protein n=1 Tax=Candidatus Desulfatibia profunda TaxID=2841695 RepID=A0A8J6NRP3_9BACT|nr:hypothetical protein [Candidatus Desulfatibia profunda]
MKLSKKQVSDFPLTIGHNHPLLFDLKQTTIELYADLEASRRENDRLKREIEKYRTLKLITDFPSYYIEKNDQLSNDLYKAQAELLSSESIREAEKKILIKEIEANTKLKAELVEAYEYAKLNADAASEANLEADLYKKEFISTYEELRAVKKKVAWYFECEEIRHWFFERTDIYCLEDSHFVPSAIQGKDYCPWCTPNGEIEMSYQQARADLWRDDEG